MKNIHPIERPREKLIKYGPLKLTDEELLAILLRHGYKKEKVMSLSHRINALIKNISHFNSWIRLKETLQIGSVQTCQLMAAYEYVSRLKKHTKLAPIITPYNIWDQLVHIRDKRKEYCVIFYLNVQNIIIHRETISVGSLNASIIHPREVYEPAVRLTAGQIIMAHNHPSGNTEPSSADIDITERIRKAGDIMGIPLLDHIIVTKESWFSFKENGLLSS